MTAAAAWPPSGFDLGTFIRSAGVLSTSSLASLARAVITAKLLAVTLGPTQVGILTQLLNFSAFLFTILPLGLTSGVAKMVAESREDARAAGRVVGTSALISLGSGIGVAVALAPFAAQLSELLTGSDRYSVLVLLIVASFPLYNLAGVLGYVLQGLSDVPRLTAANLATTVLALVVLVPATLAYGLLGAIAAVLVTSVTQSAIFAAATWRAYRARGWAAEVTGYSAAATRVLLRYGGIMIVAGAAQWGSLLLVRTILVRRLGQFDNGIYQVAYGLSSQYMTIFMTWMGAYVAPRLAAERDPAAVSGLLNAALRANLFIMVPGLVLTVALRDPLIQIFYSGSFLAASPLIPVQVVGDFARVVAWSFGVGLFMRGRTRGYLLVMLLQAAAWVVLTPLLMPALGLGAVVVAYTASYLLWPLIILPMTATWLHARPTAGGWALVAAGLLSLAIAIALPQPWGLVAAPIVPALVYLQRRRAATAD
jgi:enterobacterial common antigen flippase